MILRIVGRMVHIENVGLRNIEKFSILWVIRVHVILNFVERVPHE